MDPISLYQDRYYPSQNLYCHGYVDNQVGNRFGRWEFFHNTEESKIFCIGHYDNYSGAEIGLWIYYNEDGQVTDEKIYIV